MSYSISIMLVQTGTLNMSFTADSSIKQSI